MGYKQLTASKKIALALVIAASAFCAEVQASGPVKQTDEAGKAEAEFRVPITTLREILEDGVTQEATVVLEPGKGYNVVKPATATVKLKDL